MNSMPRKKILICDDQPKFINAFKEAHKDRPYKIEEEKDIRKLLERIEGDEPDLVLLDLYHPKDDKNDFPNRLEMAEAQLKKLDEQIEETKKAVDSAWEPLGIEVLKKFRETYKDIPVVIFSQTGPILLDDKQIQSVIINDGYFMMKKEHNMRNMNVALDSIMDNKSFIQGLKSETESYKQKAESYEKSVKAYKRSLIISWIAIPLISIVIFFLMYKMNYMTFKEISIGTISSILASIIIGATIYLSKAIPR